MERELVFVRAGFGPDALPYEQAWELQRELHGLRADGQIPDTCLLLEHQPVYTAGRRTSTLDRPVGDPGAPVIDVDRGGKITWHGPGQLVGYPIMALDDPIDVVAYVRAIEEALIRACADLGLATTRVPGRSGVWVPGGQASGSAQGDSAGWLYESAAPLTDGAGPVSGSAASRTGGAQDRKVAAIGIRVARGVTMHGFALNCDADLAWFDRIVPCGIADATVTSLSAELGRVVPVADVLGAVEGRLAEVLGASSCRELESVADLLGGVGVR